jgi:hypothetical protein
MTASIPVLATNVRKCRRESRCSGRCGRPILVGQREARCPGGQWFHLSCYLGHEHNRDGYCATTDVPGNPARAASPPPKEN